MTERWRNVVGYEAEYEVSDLGRVRSKERIVRNSAKSLRVLRSQIIAPYSRPSGYQTVKLAKANKKTSHYVHRLVAAAFIGPGNPDQEVCHRDGRKGNNASTNLYWGTRLENMADRYRLGESARGEAHGHAKLSASEVIRIRGDERLQRVIAAEYGISRRLVGMIKRGQVWAHLHG